MTQTYGVGVLLAEQYHKDDSAEFDLIITAMDLGSIVASSFQLCHMLLHTFPAGKLSEYPVDIREEAFDYFASHLEKGAVEASAFSGADPRDVVTAITTIVMGTIEPLLKGDGTPTVSVEHEGLDERGFLVVLAAINEAAVETFRYYIPELDVLNDLGRNPTYLQASQRLLSLIPKLTRALDLRDSKSSE